MNTPNTRKSLVIPLLFVFLAIIIGLLVLLLFRGNEDTWLCVNGEWVKHGNPSISKPTQICESGKDSEVTGEENTEDKKNSPTSLFKPNETDLSNQGLTKVPDTLIRNSAVTNINLSDNNIESFPSQVEVWKNLLSFNVENNRVKSLPAEIRHWQKLQMLDASGNGMTNVPAEIGQLNNLREIDFSDNMITEFPNEILNLTGLETLDIRNNPVKPEHLEKLRESLVNTTILY